MTDQTANGGKVVNGAGGAPGTGQVQDDVLVLPRFKKNQRVLDFADHSWCCDGGPPDVVQSDKDTRKVMRNGVGVLASAASHVGGRDHMEDRHSIHYGTGDSSYKGFFGVFDGHGGEEAAHFACKHLHVILRDISNAALRGENIDNATSAYSTGSNTAEKYAVEEKSSVNIDWKPVLMRSFDILEDQVLRLSREVGCRDGTTVTSVLITDDTIFCCNTGDSRTVLCRDGSAIALSEDHKPGSESEKERIEAAGGTVRAVMADRQAFCCFKAKKVPQGALRLWPGGFSVSRAVGDIDYKDLRRKKTNVINVLIHRPDVTATTRSNNDQFLILGSDGLWDVLTTQQACDFVLKELKKKKVDASTLAQKLADKAFSLGSEDNITALVIVFCKYDWEKLKP